MKTPYAIVVATMIVFAPPGMRAGVLTGPITNEANGHLYYLLTPSTWSAAEAEATSLGGHLVTMNDTSENHWVYTNFTAYGGVPRALWIGLTDRRAPGNWEWVSGEPMTLTNYWISGEPNNAPTYGPQHWAMLWPDNDSVSRPDREKWNDYWDVTTTMDQYAFDLHGVVEVRPRSTNAALESGLYQTLPGATVEERGDRVPNGSRLVPLCAAVTLDLRAAEPSLTAMIANAVLEGGDPFALTVRSSSGSQLPDGTYRFMGDYLRDIYPSGTQYLFDWRFSMSTNGHVVWNGITGWAGGHAWIVTISNITIVPAARLSISRVGTASVRISWATNFSDHVLEDATNLPAAGWSPVTNTVTTVGDRFSVTVDTNAPRRFYRLRKP